MYEMPIELVFVVIILHFSDIVYDGAPRTDNVDNNDCPWYQIDK